MKRTSSTIGQRGAALLIVLWSAIAIAGLATVVAGSARSDIAVARNQVAEAQARYLLQGAVRLGGLALLNDTGPGDPLVRGEVELSFADRLFTIRYRDECGKVDLNTAWGDLVRRIVEAHAVRTEASIQAAAVLDWRDPDSIPGAGGAENADYRALGRDHGARNGPYDTVAELQQLPGASAAFVESIRRDVTVDCLNAGLDPMVATVRALESIPGLDDNARERFLAARDAYRASGATGPEPSLAGGGRYIAASPGLAVEVEASPKETPEGPRWRAVVWLTGDGEHPILFRAWERPGP